MLRFASFIVAIFALATTTRADEPPSWQPFKVCSENQRYCAEVAPATESDQPTSAEWYVEAHETDPSTVVWSSPYQYDGYTGGLLSDDGVTFPGVSFWSYVDSPVSDIYRTGQRRSLKGRAFEIHERKLEKAVSYRLWLRRDERPCELISVDSLRVNTIDGRSHLVDLRTGRLSTRN